MADIPEWQKVIYQKKADSLQLVLQQTKDPRKKVDILNHMSRLLWDVSLQRSYDLGMEASTLAIKNNYPEGLLDSYSSLAVVTEVKNEYRMSIFYWEQAILTAKKLGKVKIIARLYVSILNSCFYLADYRKIIDVSLKGIPIARKAKDLDAEIHFMNSLGFVFIQQNNYDMALKCYQRALELSKELRDVSLIGKAYGNLGKLYNLQGKQREAIESYKRSIQVLTNTDWIGDYASALNGLAKAYLNDRNFEMALEYALKCSTFVELRGGQNTFDMVDYQLTLGEIYTALKKTQLAIPCIQNGLKMALGIKHQEHTKRAYEDLSKIYADLKQYNKAFEYQSKYSTLKDSLTSIEVTKKLLVLEAQAELDKKDYDIQLLSAENEITKSKHQKTNIIRNIVVGGFILMGALFFLIYNRSRLKEKNRLLAEIGHQQNILFNTVVSLQDKERKRVAEDLHDGLGSTLSTIQLNLEKLKDEFLNLSQNQKDKYNTALQLSNDAVTELRNIAHNLMPPALTKLGLIPALQNHFEYISKHSGININLSTHGFNQRLEQNIEISVFRILLEIVNNVVKHARASEIIVQFVQFENHLNMTIEDNGIGFDLERSRQNGIGIRNILSRVEYMKGSCSIDTSKGYGTTYSINLPGKQEFKT